MQIANGGQFGEARSPFRMLYLDRFPGVQHNHILTQMWKFENLLICTVLLSADAISGSTKWHPASILEKEELIFLLFRVFFVCSTCREMAHEAQIWDAAHPGKLHPSCNDHLHSVSLKWWLGSTEATCLHPHNFLHRETPVWKGSVAVELLTAKMHQTPYAWGMWNVMRPGVTRPSQSISH